MLQINLEMQLHLHLRIAKLTTDYTIPSLLSSSYKTGHFVSTNKHLDSLKLISSETECLNLSSQIESPAACRFNTLVLSTSSRQCG